MHYILVGLELKQSCKPVVLELTTLTTSTGAQKIYWCQSHSIDKKLSLWLKVGLHDVILSHTTCYVLK